jgi:hypothetical protein
MFEDFCLGAEIRDAMKRCVGPWKLEGEKRITRFFNKEKKKVCPKYTLW